MSKQTKKVCERWLLRRNYEIKHTNFWWVDGGCGFAVTGYYSTKAEAVVQAYEIIHSAAKSGQWSRVWMTCETHRLWPKHPHRKKERRK